MTRLAFTADLHVDQFGSRIDPSTGLNARLLDYLGNVGFVAMKARQLECAALVVAGDFTENKHVNSWLAGLIGSQLRRGPDRQLFLRGNHDGEIAGESMPTVLGRMAPGWTGVSRPAVHVVDDVALAFIPHLDAHWLRTQPQYQAAPETEVLAALHETYVQIARGLYASIDAAIAKRILVVHQALSGGRMSESQEALFGSRSLVVNTGELTAMGWDAIIAGHFHRAQELSADPLVAYTGSIERVDFAEEHEEKSFLVVDTDRLPAFTRIPTPARRYLTLREECGYDTNAVRGAVIRCIDVQPTLDETHLRSLLESDGAFEVTEMRHARIDQPEIAGGLSESLTSHEALEAYFADDPDADALLERGREILAEVG